MSIQDNLKKMFTNEEQTVLWKTDIWGTIAVYLTCILCSCFCTSDSSVLFKTVLVLAGVAGFTRIPCELQGTPGRNGCSGEQAAFPARDGRQNKPEGPEHRLGSKDWDPSVMSGGSLSRILLNVNFWILNWDGTSGFGSL